MIDSIKKIISGILSFFIGLIGGKKAQENQPSLEAAEKTKKLAATAKTRKSKGYFMELDEAEETQSVNGKQEVAAAKTAQSDPAKAKQPIAATTKADKTKEPLAAKVESTPSDTTKAKQSTATAAATKEKKSSAQATATQSDDKQPAEAQPPQVQLEQTAEGVKAVPAKAPASTVLNKTQTETTFAPKYLAPSASSNGRRRPGANMSSFLDMAREVKTPG